MSDTLVPREVTSVVMEETPTDVIVTWGLGAALDPASYHGYGIDYYGNGGKRFGVRFTANDATAHVFEWASGTQANYTADAITHTDTTLTIHYRDASIGLDTVGTINAFAHRDGTDTQVDVPVTLLR